MISFVLIAVLTLMPGSNAASHEPTLCITCGELGGVDNVLNVLLFLPFGLGLRLAGMSRRRAFLIAFGTTVAVETLQLHIVPGRDASVGDVLMNSLGGLLGIALADYRWAFLRPRSQSAERLLVAWSLCWLGIVALSGWLIEPLVPSGQYRAELAPDLPSIELFEGHVLRALLNDRPLAQNGAASTGDSIRAAIRNGTVRIDATVIPAGPTFDLAPIVNLGPVEKPRVVMLGENGNHLAFRVDLRSQLLRLRNPAVVVPNAFSTASRARDSIRIAGSITRNRALRAEAGHAGMGQAQTLVLHPFLGWWLLLPMDLVHTSRADLFSGLWVAMLLLPTGYWSACAVWGDEPRRRALTRTVVLSTCAALGGVALVPLLLGFPLPPAPVWGGAVFGMMLGIVLHLATARSRHARVCG